MTDEQKKWAFSRNQLGEALSSLGFPYELADTLAKQLGSPKAIDRMTSYLYQARPRNLETIVDEMLAICEEIAAWRRKKSSELASARYYEMRDEIFPWEPMSDDETDS
ncbi:MAG: hypothetical protein J6P72_09260 [Firmicutes bacterium]|nr:hypothetical protein [Bacillota bacterium]